MEKISVYVMTKTDTAKGIGNVETKGYTTYKDAYDGMLDSIREYVCIDFNKLTDLYLVYLKDFDCGENHATIKSGNPCYWEIHKIEVTNPLVPMLVEYCFKSNGVTEPHRNILESLAMEVAKSRYNNERLDNAVDDLVQDSLIGESIYQNAYAAITPKQSDEIDDAIEHYLNSELTTDNDGTWFDKMLAICDSDPKAISAARRKIDEKLSIGSKLSDFDVTVKLTLPKSMLEKMLSTGKVSMNYE